MSKHPYESPQQNTEGWLAAERSDAPAGGANLLGLRSAASHPPPCKALAKRQWHPADLHDYGWVLCEFRELVAINNSLGSIALLVMAID